MTRRRISRPRTRAEQAVVAKSLTTEEIIADIDFGHTMDGMPLTAADIAALERLDRGETTIEEERERILAEIAADRESSDKER